MEAEQPVQRPFSGRTLSWRPSRPRSQEGELRMNHNRVLTIVSLLSLFLLIVHLADDIARGIEKGGVSNLVAVPIAALWLYATLVLAGRRSGYVIILLG